MPRLLTVEPTAGITNRMRVVASSKVLAEALQCPLRIVWTRTSDFNCRFSDLFQPDPAFEVVESSWARSRIRRRVFGPLRYDAYYTDSTVAELGPVDQAVSRLADRKAPFVITCSRLVPAVVTRDTFAPTPALQRRIDEILADFTPHTVGVHVRRGDHTDGPRHSPTEAFLEAMTEAVDDNPETKFFLATDSPADAFLIESAFPGRVRKLTPELRRDRVTGLQDALIDLECLSHCRHVLGSYFSSFSEVAAERGGIPLTVVCRD